jgi:WD40 repeat protein
MTHGLAPSTNWYRLISIIFLFLITASVLAQQPAPTPDPQGKRGLGIKTGASSAATADQGQREAKPELIMQTGYNNFFGATRLVFSPDGRLLATTTFRSSTVKLWDTSTGRELRNLSSGGQTALNLSPVVAFSRDGRLIAAATSDNTVKVWNVVTGNEVQTLSGAQGSLLSAIGVYFVSFSEDGRRLVSGSDAIRVWDLTRKHGPRTPML